MAAKANPKVLVVLQHIRKLKVQVSFEPGLTKGPPWQHPASSGHQALGGRISIEDVTELPRARNPHKTILARHFGSGAGHERTT